MITLHSLPLYWSQCHKGYGTSSHYFGPPTLVAYLTFNLALTNYSQIFTLMLTVTIILRFTPEPDPHPMTLRMTLILIIYLPLVSH